jgi:hypothetical protein
MRNAVALGLVVLASLACDVPFAVDVFVRDSHGAPLTDARVSVHYSPGGAERTACTTDALGRCKASTVTGGGNFMLVISHAGCKTAVLAVPTHTRSRVQVQLEPTSSPSASSAALVAGSLTPG